jgi:hypothetical protein
VRCSSSRCSKHCQAELGYAQELARPLLPVQIGPVASMRVNPLAALQVIDYQNPTIETGIELTAALHARRARAGPLPVPLPMPFAYLMGLNKTLVSRQLSAAQQTEILRWRGGRCANVGR